MGSKWEGLFSDMNGTKGPAGHEEWDKRTRWTGMGQKDPMDMRNGTKGPAGQGSNARLQQLDTDTRKVSFIYP